ncbi:DUF411 domain-containing protein [Aliiroseovarius crassostreae]|uniref:DUF411 domain-containing protein n=1 Tax=Aliiroseovarius crassostreae TaxID=154981 RepID=UPI00220FC8F8|nr:DUF411 domain-containing protein [Aliiroseovarius crassostreae]UWP92306.1 DUF411 domain-containing protein [Aliiroseovarius crassostreae]
MTKPNLDRRLFVAGLAASGASLAAPAQATSHPLIKVLKDPECGCCGNWIAIMKREGVDVEVQNTSWAALSRYKETNGIPDEMASCHTGLVEGYVIEGHVPAADIRRLLSERPDAVGLSAPGMPYGSPGMGPESERDAYSIHLIRKDGSTELFTHYPAGGS